MSQPVIIKSNRYGINLILDPVMDFQDLMQEIKAKFKQSEDFFKNAKIAISFEGRELSPEEEYRIIDMITKDTTINIVCVIDNNEMREALTKQKIDSYAEQESDNTGRFYKGTLRSGQVLECETSMIILGDVNPGAKVISKGNIVILGSLKGTAYAGASGNEKCFVAALDMNPVQIKIGNVIGRSADKGLLAVLKERKKSVSEPQIAVVSEQSILIETIVKGTLNNLL